MFDPIGKEVESRWHRVQGKVEKYEPLGSSMCDIFVNGCWYASSDFHFINGDRLPCRREVQRKNDGQALASLEKIQKGFSEWFQREGKYSGWEGMRFGIAHVGNAIEGARLDVSRKLEKSGTRSALFGKAGVL